METDDEQKPNTPKDWTIASLAATQHGAFRTAQVHELKFTNKERRSRLATGRWVAPYFGVYRIAGVPVTWKGELLAACWAGGVRAAASHRSAAALWELPGGDRELVEITCPRWRRARHDESVSLVVHETLTLTAEDLTSIDGIPVTTAERTLLDLGAVRPDRVEVALDAALRRELVTYETLRIMLHRVGRRGRNGTGVLRRILAERAPERAVPESERETMLIQALRAFGLDEPVPQHEVRAGGRFIARVDLAYPDERVAIEYDSYEHHVGREALVRDSARRNRIMAAGWQVFVATAPDLAGGATTLCAAVAEARRRSRGAAS